MNQIPENQANDLTRVADDIRQLYDELNGYNHIMGDLNYFGEFNIRYWDYLDPKGRQDLFVTAGCFVMILAMCQDYLYGSGDYIKRHLNDISTAVNRFHPQNSRIAKLQYAAKTGIELVSSGEESSLEFDELTSWVFDEFIRNKKQRRRQVKRIRLIPRHDLLSELLEI